MILVTSPTAREGKSSTASNLSISLAHAGRKVLLIDADFRCPSQHAGYDLRLSPGFTQVLKDVLPFDRVVQPTPVENLELLAAGLDVSNPAELLASPRLASFLEETRRNYDVIVIDSSPLLLVTDPLIIAALADGVILVVDGTRIRVREAARAAEMLQGARVGPRGPRQRLRQLVATDRPVSLRIQIGRPHGRGRHDPHPTPAGQRPRHIDLPPPRHRRRERSKNQEGPPMICTLLLSTLLTAGFPETRGDEPAPPPESIVLRRCLLEYERSSILGAPGRGILQECLVRPGDQVEANQLLGRLQDKEARAELECARRRPRTTSIFASPRPSTRTRSRSSSRLNCSITKASSARSR